MFTIRTGLIIPTRNRPKKLYFTLRYLKINKINFYKIIVVDSSDINLRIAIKTICNKFSVELYFSKPSTSQQRNLGLKKLMSNKLEYIMFLDDDLKFYKNSFNSMDSNIKKYNKKYIGFSFNNFQFKKKVSLLEKVKISRFVQKIGIYNSSYGKILDNGWQTKIGNLKKNLPSQWLPTAALIIKKNFLYNKKFEKSFGAYSYLEDLDFSLQLNPKRRESFLVVSNAKFIHINEIIRTSFSFGYYEFINRYKIVKKFRLSKSKFFLMAFVKIMLTTFSILVNYKNATKLLGNIFAVIMIIASL
jgi:hypothetical protein